MKSTEFASSGTQVIVVGIVIGSAILSVILLAFLLSTVTVCGCAPEPPPQFQQKSA